MGLSWGETIAAGPGSGDVEHAEGGAGAPTAAPPGNQSRTVIGAPHGFGRTAEVSG